MRVQNPLTNGVPFRFANDTQDTDVPGQLTLGQVTILSSPAKPSLRGSLSVSGFDLIVLNAAPGLWTVERSTNLTNWSPLLMTNFPVLMQRLRRMNVARPRFAVVQ